MSTWLQAQRLQELEEEEKERKQQLVEERQKQEAEEKRRQEEAAASMRKRVLAAFTPSGKGRAGGLVEQTSSAEVRFEQVPDRLKLKTFILKHWTSAFLHSAGHLPSCYHHRKGVHAKVCNGLFVHYKTKEGVLHGLFKQTYANTIRTAIDMIRELAGLLGTAPPARPIPDFEESMFYPDGYPKPLPEVREPELCYCTFPMACKSHLKRLPTRDEADFQPELIDIHEKELPVLPMPPRPDLHPIPEFIPPADFKPVPEFQYKRAVAQAVLMEDVMTLAVPTEIPSNRRILAGLVSLQNIGSTTLQILSECLSILARHCAVIAIIGTDEQLQDYLDGEGCGVHKPHVGQCRVLSAPRRLQNNITNKEDVLRADMLQARELTATVVGHSSDKRSVLASPCIGLCVDMDGLEGVKEAGDLMVEIASVKSVSNVLPAQADSMPPKESKIEWAAQNQIQCFSVNLSSGPFEEPELEMQASFDESPFQLPPRPAVRAIKELPRPSEYLPYPFRPMADNLPTSINDLPHGHGPFCRIKEPKWLEPELDTDESVSVPPFQYTNMIEKRRNTPCLLMAAFLRSEDPELDSVKEFQTDERHKAYNPPAYIEPELRTFVPRPIPEIEDESTRWMPSREIENLDRFLLLEDLGSHPIFVLDAGGSMSSSKWEVLMANMLDLFSESGRVECRTDAFDIVVTMNNVICSYTGCFGTRRHLTETSGFTCEGARQWLRQLEPGGIADLHGAVTRALDCVEATVIHIVSNKYPERGSSLLDLVRTKCEPQRDDPHQNDAVKNMTRNFRTKKLKINTISFEASLPARRFLQRLSEISGGRFREFELHLSACPVRNGTSISAAEIRRGALVKGKGQLHGKDKMSDEEKNHLTKQNKFWDQVKHAIIHKGIFEWMQSLDKASSGMISTRDVVRAIRSLLEEAGISTDEMGELFLKEDDVDDQEVVDMRDLMRAVLIDGYTKYFFRDDLPLPAVRFYSLRPRTRHSIIEHCGALSLLFHEFDDECGEEELHLLPHDVMRALHRLNQDHNLKIPQIELLRCWFLVLPNDDGRIDCRDLLRFFDKNSAKRTERVKKQDEERKSMSRFAIPACQCLKSVQYSDDSLQHFLTPDEQRERLEHIQHQEATHRSKLMAIQKENEEYNQLKQSEVNAYNSKLLSDAKNDHERRLQEYYGEIDSRIAADRDTYFQRWCAKPTARNTSRLQKQAYEMKVHAIGEGLKAGGVPPLNFFELEHRYGAFTSLTAERVQREEQKERDEAYAEALEKMGGVRTVPNIAEFNMQLLRSALAGDEGHGRPMLHDIRDCPVCSLAAPFRVEASIDEREWQICDLKLIFPHFCEEMMIPEITMPIKRALAKVLLQETFFVKPTDIDILQTEARWPDPVEKYNGMRFKLMCSIHIYLHVFAQEESRKDGLEKCHKGIERLDSFMQTGEFNSYLQSEGFPMHFLRKEKVELAAIGRTRSHPKLIRRSVDLRQVSKAETTLSEYDDAWSQYVRALEAEDSRQLAADEESLEMHRRLCAAAERENHRRLKKKRDHLLKEHRHAVRDVNEKNLARLKKYQHAVKKEGEKMNEELRQAYERKKAVAEKRYNSEFDLAHENNKLAKAEQEKLSEYLENIMIEKSRLATDRRNALKVWEEAEREICLRNDLLLESALQQYRKRELAWSKNSEETARLTKTVAKEVVDLMHRVDSEQKTRQKDKHDYLWGKLAKSNEMIIEAARMGHDKNVRRLEQENAAVEGAWLKECNSIANINRENEKESIRIRNEVREHNEAELKRCNDLFRERTEAYTQLNAQIEERLNAAARKQIEEIQIDNRVTFEMARQKYQKHYQKDFEHNEYIKRVLQSTAEIREQMVVWRRFLNVVKRHWSDKKKSGEDITIHDPEEEDIRHIETLVPDLVKTTAEKVFSSWWHECGPTEQLVLYSRIDNSIVEGIRLERSKLLAQADAVRESLAAEQFERSTPKALRTTAACQSQSAKNLRINARNEAKWGRSGFRNRAGTRVAEDGMIHSQALEHHQTPLASNRPQSARTVKEAKTVLNREDVWDAKVKRWNRPKARRIPEKKDIYWHMFEQQQTLKPYSPPPGSALHQRPAVSPRVKKMMAQSEADKVVSKTKPPKAAHLMSWDERVAEIERQKALKNRPPSPPKAPTPPPPEPGDPWSPVKSLFEAEDKKVQPRRPQSARPDLSPAAFGSSSPRHFLWGVAAGSKLLPGGAVIQPQGLEARVLDTHRERMLLEREERERRRVALTQFWEGKGQAPAGTCETHGGKANTARSQGTFGGVKETRQDSRAELVPQAVFVEALLAAFGHLGVEFDPGTSGAVAREMASAIQQTDASSFIPMVPAFQTPNRHVPDDGRITASDGRRLNVPQEIASVGVFSQAGNLHRPNAVAFLGAHGPGRWAPAPPEPTREQQARWKTQMYP